MKHICKTNYSNLFVNVCFVVVISVFFSACFSPNLPSAKKVKAYKNKYGYFESIHNVIALNKNTKTLRFYKNNKLTLQYTTLIGKNKGDKQKEGDNKTPTGSYLLISKLTNTTSLPAFYGDFAFVLDYPTSYDLSNNKTGHGIWIHGYPKKTKRNPFSHGCVVLKNNKMQKLQGLLATNSKDANSLQNSIIVLYAKGIYAKHKHIMSILKDLKQNNLFDYGVNIVIYPNVEHRYIYRVIFLHDNHKKDYFYEIINSKAIRLM